MVTFGILFKTIQYIPSSDPAIKFSSILEKVNFKPRKNALCVCYCVFNWQEMSVFIEIWISSSSIFLLHGQLES